MASRRPVVIDRSVVFRKSGVLVCQHALGIGYDVIYKFASFHFFFFFFCFFLVMALRILVILFFKFWQS
jgi:hypothetical protein